MSLAAYISWIAQSMEATGNTFEQLGISNSLNCCHNFEGDCSNSCVLIKTSNFEHRSWINVVVLGLRWNKQLNNPVQWVFTKCQESILHYWLGIFSSTSCNSCEKLGEMRKHRGLRTRFSEYFSYHPLLDIHLNLILQIPFHLDEFEGSLLNLQCSMSHFPCRG